ncbi:MAG: GntR family transcriptional regulator [Sphingomonadales bacterium]
MADIAPEAKRTPRYIEVASDLRQRVERGEFPVGAALPTETELCGDYGVSRYTIREALRRLQDAQIVTRRQGSGTIVISQERAALFQQELGTLEDLAQYSSDVRFELEPGQKRALPESLHRYVDAHEITDWVYRRALVYQRHLRRPVAVSHVYMPPKYEDIALKIEGNRGVLFNEFEVYSGHPIEQVEQEIRAIILDDEACLDLSCSKGEAGLRATRAYFDTEGPAMISISFHPGDRYAYHMRFDRKS